MKFLFDLFPGLIFLAVLLLRDVYAATVAGMAAAFVQVAWHWFRTRKFETMHVVTLAAFVVLGGLTLWAKSTIFIKWKPTIVYWAFAIFAFGTQFVGDKTLYERMMGKVIEMPKHLWHRHNTAFALFFIFMSLLNLYIAFYYRLDMDEETRLKIWGYFKVFGTLILTFAFLVIQAMFLSKYMKDTDEEKSNPANEEE